MIPGPSRFPEVDAAARQARLAGVIFLAGFLLVRLVVLVTVALLVQGREFTDDVPMHLRMARHPLAGLQGLAGQDSQHPPLLGLAEAIFVRPLLLLMPDYYAVRLAYLAYELLTALVFWWVLARVVPTVRARLWPAAAFAVNPMGWLSTVVMAQDEIIAAFMLIMVVWLHLSNRPRAALAVCGLGVVAAKIFLLAPLLVLVLVPGRERLLERVIWGGAPVAGVTAWAFLGTLSRGGQAPLMGFSPGNAFGVNIWVPLAGWLGLDGRSARLWSSVATLAAILALILAVKARRVLPDGRLMVGLMAAALLWVFVCFYHVNPEYYVMVAPLLLLLYPRPAATTCVTLILTLPWLANLFYGLRNATQAGAPSSPKSVFLELYASMFSVDPAPLYQLWLLLSVLGTAGITVAVTFAAVGSRARPT